jgi:S1-C subfamily serine protease
MKEVLQLHKKGQVQKSRYEPAAQQPRRPEDIPTMSAMMARRKDSQCIHCHDVKVAELRHARDLGRFKREQVFTYPGPSAVGIQLDPDVQNSVAAVTTNSPAERAGVQKGDTVLSADGQRILTLADFTRVLELMAPESALPLELDREGKKVKATLKLSGAWRRTEDPSWRESLHVAGPNGGFWGRKLDDEERTKRGLADDRMAVLVTFIWGEHTRKAGMKVQDVVVKFDGLTKDMSIGQLHAHLNLNREYGDSVPLTIQRGGKDQELTLALPKERSKDD